jgi:hypothetical protein
MVNTLSAGVSSYSGFCGLSAWPWQAVKYSVRRDGSILTPPVVIPGMNAIAFTREVRALARLEGWVTGTAASHPSRLAEDGEHLQR